jgi:hypothetical protein
MATTKATPADFVNTYDWGGEQSEVLAGADLVDKAELLGRPFRIRGFKFTHNEKQNIGYVYVEAEWEPDGERFQFNDASTGIRQQVEAYFDSKGWKVELEKWVDVKIVAPKGLRKSEYDAFDGRGKPVRAKTYYLTTSGARA